LISSRIPSAGTTRGARYGYDIERGGEDFRYSETSGEKNTYYFMEWEEMLG
jgi:hypothetical protein